MSDLLRALLPALQTAEGRRLRIEDLDAVIVHNAGPIPHVPPPARAGRSGGPGFNVVLAERGRPRYFCKCRSAGNDALAHEAAVGRILSDDPSTAAHVAASHLECGEVMDVLAVRRLPGRPYYELLVKQDEGEWLSSVETIVGLVERMAGRVAAAIPAIRRDAAVRAADEGRWALAALAAEQGLARARADALAGALAEAGEVPARAQHGDLWPPNVLAHGRSYYVLDLELFGRIRVPLYDLLHMLHVCSEVRRPTPAGGASWVERLVSGHAAEAGPRDVVRRAMQRHGLAPAAAFGALVYYVVDIAARVRARGAWSADWREYLAQAERLADLIAEGVARPASLFTTGRG